ncbi:MAG TPA: ABC transporter ATP-binding protein, partial [Bacteroidota bacterium]|nr:ABC transporter ATP-binding protein [Bacteroidota bacterium]
MPAVEMRSITRRFGALVANDTVNFSASEGEIHALVGENGAGKSTLMKILYGIEQPDAGEIAIDGRREDIRDSTKAIALGIGMVHQHFMLIPPLTVAENIILGSEPVGALGILNIAAAEDAIRKLSETYRFNLNPRDTIASLSVGEQQRVEILKLLYRKAEIIILDEPTAILTPQEVEEFFGILRTLKEQGKTIIFIGHKVSEILGISDRVTVMRKGKVVGTVATASTNANELGKMMVGKSIESLIEKAHSEHRKQLLRVENLSCQSHRISSSLKNVSFTIESGEIFGIAAVEGNGQSELIEILTGLRKPSGGSLYIEGMPNLAHIPEDRLKHGLVLDFTLQENFILGRQRETAFSSPVSLNRNAIANYAAEQIRNFQVDPPEPMNRARQLSGGNQQKVVLGRELSKNA